MIARWGNSLDFSIRGAWTFIDFHGEEDLERLFRLLSEGGLIEEGEAGA